MQMSGTCCVIQLYSPFYPLGPIGILIKRESKKINQPHLQILLLVCCLFVRSGRGKDGRKSTVMGRLSLQLSSSTVGSFPVGATGDLGPVFAFLGTHRGGVCSWRHWGRCQRPCWSWDCDSRFQDLICSQWWGTVWSWQILTCRLAMFPWLLPLLLWPQAERQVTSGHTQLSSTTVWISCISLGSSAQWTRPQLQTASDLAAY